MTEAKEPIKTGSISGGKNTLEIIFGEKTYTIHKLKAGKFYELLQVYMEMIKDVSPKNPVKGEEATVDFDTLIVSMFKNWPAKMAEFIVICCSSIEGLKEPLTKERILEEAYPEQITETFSACLKLNNVAQNLKNFVAPIGELGAATTPAK